MTIKELLKNKLKDGIVIKKTWVVNWDDILNHKELFEIIIGGLKE